MDTPGRAIQLRAQLCVDTCEQPDEQPEWHKSSHKQRTLNTRTACEVVTNSMSFAPHAAPTTSSPPTSRREATPSTMMNGVGAGNKRQRKEPTHAHSSIMMDA